MQLQSFTCAGFIRQALLLGPWCWTECRGQSVGIACLTFHSSLAPVLQVKVWLGETQAHYYILSRFLISRMLTVTKIPYMKVGDTRCTLQGCACVHVMCQC